MTAVQLADGVWRLPTAPFDAVNSFLLAGDDGTLVLVDAGTRRAPRTLLAALAQLGRAPGDLTHLLLTHAHNDHAGGAKAVVEATGAQVGAHEREAVHLREGRMPAPDPSTAGGRLLARLPGALTGFARVDVDTAFTDGDVLPVAGGVRVVHTPGHTPGHCSFLHPGSGVLITGDAVFNVRGLRYSFAGSCTDVRLSRTSAAVLGELDYDVAAFTHGPHVATGARAAVQAFLAGAALVTSLPGGAVLGRALPGSALPGSALPGSALPGYALPRPGRRALLRVGYAGGAVTALTAATAAVFQVEARLARRTIGTPTASAPDPTGSYGRGRRGTRPLHVVVLGDSAAAGLGCERADQTPGALIAGGIARDLRRRVVLRVVARTGARTAGLDTQVGHALRRPVDLAFLIIGANDVTHKVPVVESARDLSRAVRTLRAAGAEVVVGTCPDLGTVKPLLQPLRSYARYVSRRLAAAQTVAVVEEGGVAVSLGDLLAQAFHQEPHLWSPDRFHPSAEGYRRIVDAALPSLLQAAGVDIPVSVPVSDTVQDLAVAASVAAREPGLVVETVEGTDGAAADGPGRLARLTRRLPLLGRGAPEARLADDEPEASGPDRPA